ncbi:DUF6875 domain-containing protein [Rhodococcus sp. IEGM 1379]|uniref:DUF6875 domain-containing protein n=1 Tax=Rhodococcus sp. IEGM 1379 TaxID=3047086 RepID=UPI0024B69D14|nr:hypothetical protein [Rhodococcus sp. IEGM 1379]MDI9917421.1 hypothetical protein [Rhodococcus sp. IEGM 1379]
MTTNWTTKRIIGTRSHLEFINVFDDESLESQSGTIRAFKKWALEFLTEPHPDLGRAGPVCPFTGPSVDRKLFWAGVADEINIDFDSLSAIAEDMADIYQELPPSEGKDAIFRAIVAIFPNISDFNVIETVQLHGKSKFVKNGLMLGQFYPGCRQPGLWSEDFRPLDSPLPMLAVRQMVSTDYPFLATRSEWMSAYLKKFAPTMPSPARAYIVAKITS